MAGEKECETEAGATGRQTADAGMGRGDGGGVGGGGDGRTDGQTRERAWNGRGDRNTHAARRTAAGNADSRLNPPTRAPSSAEPTPITRACTHPSTPAPHNTPAPASPLRLLSPPIRPGRRRRLLRGDHSHPARPRSRRRSRRPVRVIDAAAAIAPAHVRIVPNAGSAAAAAQRALLAVPSVKSAASERDGGGQAVKKAGCQRRGRCEADARRVRHATAGRRRQRRDSRSKGGRGGGGRSPTADG